MNRVLFLNPPGDRLFIRDYYCSKVSKADYLPQPIDLLIQTGFFADPEINSLVIDSIAEKLNPRDTLRRVVEFDPALIVTQCGSVSWRQDSAFFKDLKSQVGSASILASGDLFLENPEKFLDAHSWLDGIITDFFLGGSLEYFKGEFHKVRGLVFKRNGHIINNPSNGSLVNIPTPLHDKFKNKLYRYPFATGYPMATVLTNYACPYPCTFCIMSTLQFKSRTAEEVIKELEVLRELGTKYIYFSDQTFYLNPKITEPILDYMAKVKPGFQWVCFSRVDLMTEEKLLNMKAAGCNVIMFGVEWAEEEYLKRYKKEYTTEQIRHAFELTKGIGIRRMGTFLIGVPGQSRKSIRNTVDFAIELEADYASFNVAVPRANTSFRQEAIDQGLITESDQIMDQSGSFITMGTGILSADEIMELKKEAYRKFYLRPHYLWKRLRSVSNRIELATHLREGYQMIKNIV